MKRDLLEDDSSSSLSGGWKRKPLKEVTGEQQMQECRSECGWRPGEKGRQGSGRWHGGGASPEAGTQLG